MEVMEIMELKDNELIMTRKEKTELFFICVGSFLKMLIIHPILTLRALFSKNKENT